MKKQNENKRNTDGKMTIWDIYQDALSPKVVNCDKKYKLCPLTKQDLTGQSLLSGFY